LYIQQFYPRGGCLQATVMVFWRCKKKGCAFVVDRRWWNHHELMQLMWEAYAADPVSIGVP
jgi:hypothetical protein